MDQEQAYKKVSGIITELEKLEDGSFMFASESEGDTLFHVRVPDTNLVFDTHGVHVFLEEGKEFKAFLAPNKPMILIHPPQYTPDLLIIESEELGFVEVSIFNDDFVSSNNRLKLHVDESTKIVNLAGAEIPVTDVAGKNVAVFYGRSTRSIPAQTTPKKILILE